MKKIILGLMAVMLSLTVFSQKQGYYLAYVVPTSTTPTTEYIKAYSFVMVAADTTLYLTKINIGRGRTIANTMLTSPSNYAVINRAIFGGKATTFFVDTANAQNIYGVKAFKNNATFAGTVAVTGNVAINTNKFNVTASNGNTAIAGTLDVTSNVAVNTNKFVITASNGNTFTYGTLGVVGGLTCLDTVIGSVVRSTGMTLSGGDFKVNTNKFNVTASNGNTTVAGTLGVTGNVAVNTNKFTVTASSGNTVIAGTAAVTGLATLSAGAVITADTTTAVVGKIVYVAADSSFYGCRSTSAAKKWYKLN